MELKVSLKSLISDFLSGKFIQPIHLRLMDDNTYEIIDGGHRSRTLMNFFLGKLKTPEGLELEYKGKIFKIGSMTWTEISTTHTILRKNLMDTLQFFVIESLFLPQYSLPIHHHSYEEHQ